MVVGALIIFFLIVEPHGLARLWQIGKQKLAGVAFPVLTRQTRVQTLRVTARGKQDDRLSAGDTKGRNAMGFKNLAVGMAVAGLLGGVALPAPAIAQDSIYVPLLTYRTGPFAGSGIPIANGMNDYLQMLNERDGGIGGVKLVVEECETGYDTKKGVECYEQVKSKKPVIINPWSTGITLQLIPKAAVDKIPVLSMAYGLSAAAVGNEFPWVFNPPATYWDGLSMIFRYIGGKEGGLDKLKGKTIGYIYLRWRLRPRADSAARAVRQGLRLHGEALSGPGSRNAEPVGAMAQRAPRQAGLDDHVGLGCDEPDRGARSRHASTTRWTSSSASGGPAARTTRGRPVKRRKAIPTLNFSAVGANFPAIQDISQERGRQGQGPEPEGQGRRGASTTRASTIPC